MTDRHLAAGRSPRNSSNVLKWQNDSGETIPAYACVKLQSYDSATDLYSAVKPDGSGHLYFANGPVPVESGKYSESMLWNKSQLGLTDGSFGDSVGPVDDSWNFSSSGSGFVVFSTPGSGVAAILQVGSGAGSIRHAIVRECYGGGYYLAEFANFQPTVPDSGAYASGECDPCVLISESCDDDNDPDSDRQVPEGTGEYVTIYDIRELPLTLDRHIIIANLGDSDSTASGHDGTIWIVIEANRPLTKLKVEDWDCCDGTVTRVSCEFYLIEAHRCEGEETPCPSV